MGKRVFANYYFEVKFGQGVKANKYFEEIKAEALKLGIADVHMGRVEIGVNAPFTYFSLVFESADAFGRQWGSGSENEAKGAEWRALWLRLSQEPTQVLARKGSDLIYEQQNIKRRESESYFDLFSWDAIFRTVNKVVTARSAIGIATM